ncbi:MAG: DEAD/DEAH box helicase [Candidatus Nealsonbacteria bacterium]|nr:DEAD/DEAH box helicase [Candidatus Nealsonbacteria bacterium]
MSIVSLDKILIVSITPYFLERGNVWFEENLEKILEARRTQSFFEDNVLCLERNQDYGLSPLLRKLDELGYEKVLEVQDPGEFSSRGGIVDVFPVNLNWAVRFDFLGNKIESIERLPIELQDETIAKEILKKRLKSQKIFSDLKGLKPGDCLVHLDHGIGIYRERQTIGGNQYYVLEYAQNDKLYVPLGLERKLSRYVGFADPKISRLGSALWQKTKKKIKADAEKMAKELLEIYAKREVARRPPYLPEEEIQREVAGTFKYLETPDQMQAIQDIKNDMEKPEPMDRIVCGDVGFGKTEVALRAIIKAVVSGQQAALLCPTTILAYQHYQNLKERLKNSPLKIILLSRLQTKKEQMEAVKNLKEGKADVVIGTHRILSNDVQFKSLGLLVIDDEQRFGVKQKEKFKMLRSSLDILSLSATPIPRTLYMALSSLKKVSLIQTPPEGRMPVKTFVSPWKAETIKKAFEEEFSRKGQVYFLYNRVETIDKARIFLEKLLPRARFGIAHGRMRERELIKIMTDFQEKKIDVLIATTIIENGIDLPNVNTLVVADATKLGLAQAYQIRGRIGRSHQQAFAYFLYPKKLAGLAKERLKALKEAEELGSGYRIALKDLEIRGAGNILGREQSGDINKVGLNLYCQMLSEAIEKIKSQG